MTPIKRGLDIFVILSLLLLPFAFAVHTAVVTANTVSIYETNTVELVLDVENYLSSTSTINKVDVQNSGFNINGITTLVDWSVLNNNSILFSTETAGISNWGSQKFGFDLEAGNVDEDTTYNWIITTTDTNSESQQNTIQLTILNDATPPVITATTPGPFVLGGNELFSVTANDPETAVSGAELQLSNCDEILDPETNETSVEYDTIDLTCDNGVCSSTQDFSSWPEGDVCFYYDVHNRGGETATSSDLTTIIDRTAPTVTLNAPDNNAFLDTTSVQLDFTAIDNYDTELECNVNVDGTDNTMTANGDASYTTDLADGSHSWSISCSDEVDLVGTSETRTVNVDTAAPVITLISPSVVDRGTDAVIAVEIIDTGIGVDASSVSAQLIDTNGNVTDVQIVDGQITIPTAVETNPGIYTVTVNAADSLGHSAAQQTQFRLRETFTLILSVNPSQIDASTENNTMYSALTGTITKDEGSIPTGTVNVQLILTTEDLEINNETGAFETHVQIPTENGGYTITATYVNGEDTFTATAGIAVGPYCGNNIVNENEECDGSTTAMCADYGFSEGTTSCTATCTIDTSQCSNPPETHSSGGGGGRRHSSSYSSSYAAPIYIPPEEDLISGIIETPEPEPIVEEPQEELISGTIETPVANETIIEKTGAAWAPFTQLTKKINKSVLVALLILGLLLYLLGWRKKEDEWDNYFKKYGHK